MKLNTTTIEQVVFINAKPEDVFDALMDAKKHSEFTGSKATSQPKVGGKFTAWDGYIIGKHLVLERAKKIVQEWKTTEWPEGYPPSTLKFSLKANNDGTKLTMLHSNVPTEQAKSYAKAGKISTGSL